MAGLIEQLIETVSEQNKIYAQLLEISMKKKSVIIENNIEELQKIVTAENSLVGKSSKLEKARNELFNDISFVLNKKSEEMSLTKIAELMEGKPEAAEIIKVRDEAAEVIKKLKAINDINKDLIEYSLDHIDFSMNVLRSTLSNEPYYYDSAGNEINSPNKRLFDIKQ